MCTPRKRINHPAAAPTNNGRPLEWVKYRRRWDLLLRWWGGYCCSRASSSSSLRVHHFVSSPKTTTTANALINLLFCFCWPVMYLYYMWLVFLMMVISNNIDQTRPDQQQMKRIGVEGGVGAIIIIKQQHPLIDNNLSWNWEYFGDFQSGGNDA